MARDTKTPEGFSEEKGDHNYFLDAIRDFWTECDMDTDTEEIRWIINWFDDRRRKPQEEERLPSSEDVKAALDEGWEVESPTNQLHLVGDKSQGWAARWIPVAVDQATIRVPHWLNRRRAELRKA